jgi:hypothetical protein
VALIRGKASRRALQPHGPHCASNRAREIREYYTPGDFQNWKNHDAFETAFAKLLQDLRTSADPSRKSA